MTLHSLVGKLKRNLWLNPPILGAALAFAWEWLRLDFQTLRDFPQEPISSVLGLVFLYVLGVAAATGIEKLQTSTEFCADSQLKAQIENLVDSAQEYMFVVSPYLDPGNVVLESMIRASNDGINVTLVHHSSQIRKPSSRDWIVRLIRAGVVVYNHPNLHAKLYANESEVVVASMNLVSGSYSNSFEAGVYSDSRELRNSVLSYIDDVIISSDMCSETIESDAPPEFGFCIRTKSKIPYNPQRPIERTEYLNSGRPNDGSYCHSCGHESSTSVEEPLCELCRVVLSSSKV